MELGIYTFADMVPEGTSGKAMNAHQRMKDLMEESQLADQVGLDVFALATTIGRSMPFLLLLWY